MFREIKFDTPGFRGAGYQPQAVAKLLVLGLLVAAAALALILLAPGQTGAANVAIPGNVEDISGIDGSGEALVRWNPPSDAAANPPTHYQYRVGLSGAWQTVEGGADASYQRVENLRNGVAYLIYVRPCNAAGCGDSAFYLAQPRADSVRADDINVKLNALGQGDYGDFGIQQVGGQQVGGQQTESGVTDRTTGSHAENGSTGAYPDPVLCPGPHLRHGNGCVPDYSSVYYGGTTPLPTPPPTAVPPPDDSGCRSDRRALGHC